MSRNQVDISFPKGGMMFLIVGAILLILLQNQR